MSQKFVLIGFTFSLLWMLISTTPITPVEEIVTTQETTSTQETTPTPTTTAASQSIMSITPAEEIVTTQETTTSPETTPTPTTTSTSQSITPITPAEEIVTSQETTLTPNTTATSQSITSITPAGETTPTPTTTVTSESMTNLISLTNKTECGKSSDEFPYISIPSVPIKGIVAGHNAAFGVWAWQVSIRESNGRGRKVHSCGGSLLNEYWILTAAHCVRGTTNDQLEIRVGDYDFSNKNTKYPFAEHNVTKIVMHPKYGRSSHLNDAALIQVTEPIKYGRHIVPICLPGFNDSLSGENSTITGWGSTETIDSPNILQEVSLPILDNKECENFLQKSRHKVNITDSFLCAGLADGGPDSCQGDSGGPLQVKSKDGRYFIAGIVSWGYGCGKAYQPGIYTRVTTIVPWILETIA